MAHIQGGKNKKNLNVELNLLPVFDVLSVCICFLLMTVVWIEIRSLETKQTYGSESSLETAKTSTIWLTVDEANSLTMTLKSPKGQEIKSQVPAKNGQIDFSKVESAVKAAVSQNYRAAHLLPARNTKYDQIIHLMDLIKMSGINDIGLSPI